MTICLTIIGQGSLAQGNNSVSGRITDSSNGSPVPYATVFLVHTLIGSRTNDDGVYALTNIPPGKYELVISNVGYKMRKAVLEINADERNLDMALTPEVTVLKEVTVKTSKSEYLKNVKIFKEHFLGRTLNAKKCMIKNIDDVELLFDRGTNVFYASCAKPVEVENRALGFRIFYIMQKFSIDFNSKIFTMSGIPRFEELYPDAARNKTFTASRVLAYNGSLNHFMRSLRNNRLASNKFSVAIWRRPYYTTTAMPVPLSKYDFYSISAEQIAQIRPDSLLELRIIYSGALQEYNYDTRQFGSPQTSYFNYLKHNLIIHENGYYDDPLDFFLEGYFIWRENVMAELLPLEYQPVITDEKKKAMDAIETDEAVRLARVKQRDIQ